MCRLLLLLLATLVLQTIDAGAQQVKLRASIQVPITDAFFGVSLVRFKEEVEKRSGNTIAIEIFDNGRLYVDDQIVDAVASGAVEMGVAGANQFTKKVTAVSILEQPFLFNFDALVRATASPDSEIRSLIDAAVLDKVGVRVLWWQSLGNTLFYSKGGDVAQPQQIRGQKVRVFSRTMAQLVADCGGTPIMLSTSKLPEALRDGAVDLAMAGLGSLQPRELWKVTDTITRTEHAPVEYFLVMNERTWASLSPHHQSIITDVAKIVERQTRDRLAEIESAAFAVARKNGMQLRDLTPDEVADWRACSSKVLDDYMEKNADLASQLMAAYAKLRTEPCCTSRPGTGTFSRR